MNKSVIRKLCCLVFIFLIALSAKAQMVTLRYQQIPLSALIDSLSKKTSIKISYDVKAVPVDSLINVDEQGIHPYSLLKSIIEKRPLNISLKDNQIIISEKINNEPTAYIRLKGKVVDEADSTILPMVNISIKNRALGTITNMDGDFEFVVPQAFVNDTLMFSFIGYSRCVMPLHPGDTLFYVRMKRHDVKLKEVEVRYASVDHIMEEVSKNKSHNYFNQPTLLTGFFRESIKQDSSFVQVSEAIIEIQKPSYLNMFNLERVRFVKGRKLSGLQPMEMINFKLEGGPYQFSRIDVARYFDFLPKKEGGDLFKYKYDGIDYINGEMVYRIGFSPLNDDGELKYMGKLFIHAKSYALIHVTFELTKKALKNSRKALIRKASRKIKAKPLLARYYIDYRMYNDKWILNKVGGEIVVHINDRNQHINSVFTGISELLISDCRLYKDDRFKPSELFKLNYVLADEIKETDSEFWENYNIIKPDEELEKVFKESN